MTGTVIDGRCDVQQVCFMGGKKGATDPKAEAERKKYLAEKKAQKEADKTFGLKNKNKSKVVQQCEPLSHHVAFYAPSPLLGPRRLMLPSPCAGCSGRYVKKVQEGTTAISAKDRRLQAERDAEASAAGKAGKQAAKLAKERELAELFDEVLKQPKVPEGTPAVPEKPPLTRIRRPARQPTAVEPRGARMVQAYRPQLNAKLSSVCTLTGTPAGVHGR
jgi:hypothetical protein